LMAVSLLMITIPSRSLMHFPYHRRKFRAQADPELGPHRCL
jgi:hypothetical protein